MQRTALLAVVVVCAATACSNDLMLGTACAGHSRVPAALGPVGTGPVIVSTLAGDGDAGVITGNARTTACNGQLDAPTSLAVDPKGNVYINSVLGLERITSNGAVSTVEVAAAGAGIASPATSTLFFAITSASGLASDTSGNIYVVGAGVVVKVVPDSGGEIVAGSSEQQGDVDGSGGTAEFNNPQGLAVDGAGNIYVADTGNNCIRKIAPDGTTTTLAGNGTAGDIDGTGGRNGTVEFDGPVAVAVDPQGNVYVADSLNSSIRKVGPDGTTTTLAGNGLVGDLDGTGGATGTAEFDTPNGVAVDGEGNVYVADTGNMTIRVITTDGTTSTLAGTGANGSTGGSGAVAQFSQPKGVALDQQGNLYVADTGSSTVRLIQLAPGPNDAGPSATTTSHGVAAGGPVIVSTVAGNGQSGYNDGAGSGAEFNGPEGIAVDAMRTIYVADKLNQAIREVMANGSVATRSSADPGLIIANLIGITVDRQGNIFTTEASNQILQWNATVAGATVLAGDGTAGDVDGASGPHGGAEFDDPRGVAVDRLGNVYVADTGNNRIRMITSARTTSTFAGNGTAAFADGSGGADGGAAFNGPQGVAVDNQGNVYVADTGNNRIRLVTPNGATSTLAGNGAAAFADGSGGPDGGAAFNGPRGVAVDNQGNVYVADTGNNRIRLVQPGGATTTIAGNGTPGFAEGSGGPNGTSEFNGPEDVAVDDQGNVYVADTGNNRIRILQ